MHETNGAAWEQDSLRTGIPLSYVSEKLGLCLLWIRAQPGNKAGFGDGIKAYLGLHNMLALHDQSLVETLWKMSSKQFDSWLEHIADEGSLE